MITQVGLRLKPCPNLMPSLSLLLVIWCYHASTCLASEAERVLHENLFKEYNKVARPVNADSETLVVFIRLKLSRIIDVHEKTQVVTTIMWLHQEWFDSKLTWSPKEYGGVNRTTVDPKLIWLPDIVLYNNADGRYEIPAIIRATIWYDGRVIWQPASLFKSQCNMNLEHFPFDVQSCTLKFGAWSYDGFQVDLIHWKKGQVNVTRDRAGHKIWVVLDGIDLSEYFKSVQWDVLSVRGTRRALLYPCCDAPFVDITYDLVLRRKPLFYTINLLTPCFMISVMTIVTFYLPAVSKQKMSLCISSMVALTVFLLLLIELIPPNSFEAEDVAVYISSMAMTVFLLILTELISPNISKQNMALCISSMVALTVFLLLFIELIPSTGLVVPLVGKYLLFTLFLVTATVILSVVIVSIHCRCAPNMAPLSAPMKRWFLYRIPRLLLMEPLMNHPIELPGLDPCRFVSSPILKPRHRDGYEAISQSDSECTERNLCDSKPDSKIDIPIYRTYSKGRIVAEKKQSTKWSETPLSELWNVDPPAYDRLGLEQQQQQPQSEVTPPPECNCDNKELSTAEFRAQLERVAECVGFIADKIREREYYDQVSVEWKYVAMVLDRFFLYTFSLAFVLGSYIIFSSPPSVDIM